MSETAEVTETADAATADAPEQPKPTETVDFWKAKAREQEKRAKANAEAAQRLAAIEESQKTEAQKQADRLAELERETVQARAEALRLRVATKHGISDEDADLFLTGSDEETLTKQAKRLAERVTDQRKQGNHVPREGSNPRPEGDDMRGFAKSLFKNVD